MADEKFDLIFQGELVPGADLAQVKQNLSRLFKMDPARVEKLFSGRPVVLKKGVDMDAAAKYRVAIKKAGARIETRPSASVTAEASAKRPAPEPAAAPAQPAAAPPAELNTAAGLSLAPMAGDLLRNEEKSQQPERVVDTSALSLRPAGGALVDSHEVARPKPVDVNIVDVEVAPVGEDVLKPEERLPLPEVEMDLSAYTLAPPADRLQPPAAPPPPAPDISGLSLVDE